MALDNFKCNHLMPLHFKGLKPVLCCLHPVTMKYHCGIVDTVEADCKAAGQFCSSNCTRNGLLVKPQVRPSWSRS